jgi:DNA ligase (NAD+)
MSIALTQFPTTRSHSQCRLLLLRMWLAGALFGGLLAGVTPGVASIADEREATIRSEEIVARVNGLRREIARHDDLYFRLAAPEISDYEYDQLKAELLALEAKYPELEYDESPVAPVGDDRTGIFATHRHLEPMLSLDKAMSEEDLLAFHRRMAAALGRDRLAYWVEPKFDGIAVSLTYENGRLVRAVTRGNGTEGDDITANVRTLDSVPASLREVAEDGRLLPVPEVIEIRGEIFMSFAEFARINAERLAAGESVFANPRNLAAGTARLRAASEAAQRRLELVCFGWGAFEPAAQQPATMEEFRDRLQAWGLPTVSEAALSVGAREMVAAVRAVERSRDDLEFPIDGAVVKLASTAEQLALGFSRSAPRWAVAVKFAPERVATRLLDITLQVGRTGVVTPVAELEPVRLAGSRVARASLHNADEIARRDLRIGDWVYIEKAGDIIPAVVGVDLEKRSSAIRPYLFPAECPECASQLERIDGRALYRCINRGCPAQLVRRMEHFASALNIRGLGPATLAALVDDGKLRTLADLYLLRSEDFLNLSGIGERSAENLLAAIEVSRESDWERVIYGLGIPGVGERRAGALARVFPGPETLAQAKIERLTAAEHEGGAGFGDAIAASVLAHLEEPATQELLRVLESLGVGKRTAGVRAGEFAGEVVVVTGALQRWTRAEITARLADAGARVSENVTRQTTLLVAGQRPGSKLERAHALGVAVIGEEELARRLGEQ